MTASEVDVDLLAADERHEHDVAPAPLPPPRADGTQQQPLQVANSSDDGGNASDDLLPLAATATAPTLVSRKRPRAVEDAAKPRVVLKAQPTECTICYDACMISGRHRLVALKCGHLFGKKCIERWVAERKTCPNCNMAVRKADVRPLFSDHVAVVDNSGVETMRQKFEDEKSKRIQAETELSRARLQMEILTADAKRHQDDALRWRKEVVDLQCRLASERFATVTSAATTVASLSEQSTQESGRSSPRLQYPSGGGGFLLSQLPPDSADTVTTAAASSSPSTSSWDYTEVYSYPLRNSRVFAIANSCSMLCVGEEFSATQFGVSKISAVDPRHAVRIIAHQSPVRDLKISEKEDLAITVAFDGKLVVSNLNSQSVVLQCPLPPGKRQGWACAFSDVDPFALYCGFHDGSVAKYDMRKAISEAVVATFSSQERQPVHSIRLFVGPDGTERLVAATFSSISVWSDCNGASISDASGLARTADARASIPSCCSLTSVQTHPGSVLVSSRTLPQAPAKHSVFDLALAESPSELVAEATVTGYRTPPVLVRSAIWEASDGGIIVASGDDESKQVLLWDAASNQVRHRLRPFSGNQVVIDVQHAVRQGSWRSESALFGVLSSQKIALFRYTG